MQTRLLHISLTKQVVSLIQQFGPQDKLQLHVHLPDHDVENIQKALEDAVFRQLLKRRGNGIYEPTPQSHNAEDDDPSAIVEQALRARTILDLGWAGALAL
jgi:hypothetical protein